MNRPSLISASALAILAAVPALALVNDPPLVEHQPPECSIVSKPIELCATVLDDGDIAKVRTYFRRPGEKEYLVSEMAFEGARFCTTLPGVKPGKLKSLEYYIQATDTEYETKRTSTFQLQIETAEECAFPAVQKDAKKAAAITVTATSAKQGNKVPDYLEPAGVTFVPVGSAAPEEVIATASTRTIVQRTGVCAKYQRSFAETRLLRRRSQRNGSC